MLVYGPAGTIWGYSRRPINIESSKLVTHLALSRYSRLQLLHIDGAESFAAIQLRGSDALNKSRLAASALKCLSLVIEPCCVAQISGEQVFEFKAYGR